MRPWKKISVASTGFYEMSAAFSDLMKKTVGRQVRFELYETSFEESMNMVASRVGRSGVCPPLELLL